MKTVPFSVPTEGYWDLDVSQENRTAANAVMCRVFLEKALTEFSAPDNDMKARRTRLLAELTNGTEIMTVDATDLDVLGSSIREYSETMQRGLGNRSALRRIHEALLDSVRLLNEV